MGDASASSNLSWQPEKEAILYTVLGTSTLSHMIRQSIWLEIKRNEDRSGVQAAWILHTSFRRFLMSAETLYSV